MRFVTFLAFLLTACHAVVSAIDFTRVLITPAEYTDSMGMVGWCLGILSSIAIALFFLVLFTRQRRQPTRGA